MSSFESTRVETVTEMNRGPVETEIKYSYVGGGSHPDIHNKSVRFAAFERQPNTSEWKPLTIEKWAKYLSSDNSVAHRHRDEFTKILAESTPHMKAYAFETKGASPTTASHKQFEFVLFNDPYLYSFAEGNPDPFTFKEHLQCTPHNAPGCAFPNLRHDALLVAPRPLVQVGGSEVSDGTYSHLAAFVRGGPKWQVNGFWKLVAAEYTKVLKERQVWLSTAGGGVAWLHVRLGKKPKYYKYEEFRSEL